MPWSSKWFCHTLKAESQCHLPGLSFHTQTQYHSWEVSCQSHKRGWWGQGQYVWLLASTVFLRQAPELWISVWLANLSRRKNEKWEGSFRVQNTEEKSQGIRLRSASLDQKVGTNYFIQGTIPRYWLIFTIFSLCLLSMETSKRVSAWISLDKEPSLARDYREPWANSPIRTHAMSMGYRRWCYSHQMVYGCTL